MARNIAVPWRSVLIMFFFSSDARTEGSAPSGMDDAFANSADGTSTRFFLSIKDRRASKTACCRSLRSAAVSLIGSEAWGLALEAGSEGCGLAIEAGALGLEA